MMVVYLANRRLFARIKYLKLVAAPTIFAPILLLGLVLDRLCPRDDRLYHNNLFLFRKP
jgi:hypothetical protein